MILIVDDHDDSGEALCRVLGRKGFPCATRRDGHEAIAYVRQHPPEQPLLVVLDEMMPGMTGMDVLRTLREDPRTSQTTVIVHSAGFDLAKRDAALTLGAAAWILKGGTAAGGIEGVIETITHWYAKIGGVPRSLPLEPR